MIGLFLFVSLQTDFLQKIDQNFCIPIAEAYESEDDSKAYSLEAELSTILEPLGQEIDEYCD